MTDVSHKLLKIRRFSHLQNQYSWVQIPSGAPKSLTFSTKRISISVIVVGVSARLTDDLHGCR